MTLMTIAKLIDRNENIDYKKTNLFSTSKSNFAFSLRLDQNILNNILL